MKLKSNSKQPEDVDRHEKVRRITVATVWFGLALALSLYVPDIDKVIVYLGGLAAIFIFVFPGKYDVQFILNKNCKLIVDCSRFQ